MWLCRNPHTLIDEKRRSTIRSMSEANKWLIINLLIVLCLLIEWKVLPIFYFLALPWNILPLYTAFVVTFLFVSFVSVIYHFSTLGVSFLRYKFWITHPNSIASSSTFLSDSRFGPTAFSPALLRHDQFNKFGLPHYGSSFLDLSPIGKSSIGSNISSPNFDASRSMLLPTLNHSGLSSSMRSDSIPSSHEKSMSLFGNTGSLSLLDIALSPISGPKSHTSMDSPYNPERLSSSFSAGIRSNPWSSPLWNFSRLSSYQYELSTPPTSPKRETCGDDSQLSGVLQHSLSNLMFSDSFGRQGSREPLMERSADDYWEDYKVTATQLDQWTLDLRKWLHGTIFRPLINEINAVNRQLTEISGEEAVIGSRTLTSLQQLCSTKYQYLPTLSVLLSFLELTKEQGYLVNRLKELSRGSCLEEFRWDSGSRSSSWPWKEHLPNDSLIILHMFATYMDLRMPPHPKCLTGRVFTQLCTVRHPDKPDLKSKFHTQLYLLGVQPPHFKLVLNGKLYSFSSERNNFYHAALMFLHQSVVTNGKFRAVSLGPSGLNVSWIFAK